MTHTVLRPTPQFLLVANKEMCIASGISSDKLKSLRLSGILPKGTYWTTIPGSTQNQILWVRDLVLDYFMNGDSPSHKKAIERYLGSLPSSNTAT